MQLTPLQQQKLELAAAQSEAEQVSSDLAVLWARRRSVWTALAETYPHVTTEEGEDDFGKWSPSQVRIVGFNLRGAEARFGMWPELDLVNATIAKAKARQRELKADDELLRRKILEAVTEPEPKPPRKAKAEPKPFQFKFEE